MIKCHSKWLIYISEYLFRSKDMLSFQYYIFELEKGYQPDWDVNVKDRFLHYMP